MIEVSSEILVAIRAAHMINIRIRVGGEWVEYEADWIRELIKDNVVEKPINILGINVRIDPDLPPDIIILKNPN